MKENMQIIKDVFYIKILIIITVLLLILGNWTINNYFDEEKIVNENYVINNLSLKENLLDERGTILNLSLQIQQEWIQDMILLHDKDEVNVRYDFMDYMIYEKELNFSFMDISNTDFVGNFAYGGHYHDINDKDLKEMNALFESYLMMDVMMTKNGNEFTSIYYSDSFIGLYPLYPDEYIGDSFGDLHGFLEHVESDMALLQDDLSDEDLSEEILNGWANDVNIDDTGEDLMIQLCRPVVVKEEVRGVICLSADIADIQSVLQDVTHIGRFLILDRRNNLIYDADEEVKELRGLSSVYSAKAEEEILKLMETEDKFYYDDHVFFTQELDQLEWRLLQSVPMEDINGGRTRIIITYIIFNVISLLILLVIINLSIKKVVADKSIAKQKDEFVMMVSHDLKSPLANILGFTERIEERFDENLLPFLAKEECFNKDIERIKRDLNIIQEEGMRLTHFIKNILDLAKLKQKDSLMNRYKCDLNTIAKKSIGQISELARQKNLEIKFIPSESDIKIYGDEYYLMQLFVNLIGNSIKYTDDGGIEVKIYAEKDGGKIIISDTGIGMNSHQLEDIMKPFVRVHEEHSEQGNGLGLSICQRIVDVHSGIIEFESEVGKGTTVSVYIPTGKIDL